MDLLYQRYASPFSFMDGMIETGRFEEFVSSFIDTVNHEKEEKYNWEFFLHKVYEQTYAEFKDSISVDNSTQNMSVGTIETTVQDSMNILKNFNPKE
jgi:hypothetical protein